MQLWVVTEQNMDEDRVWRKAFPTSDEAVEAVRRCHAEIWQSIFPGEEPEDLTPVAETDHTIRLGEDDPDATAWTVVRVDTDADMPKMEG